MNTTIIITKLKTIHWIMLQHSIGNGLYALSNRYNRTIVIKMFTST